MQILIEKMDPNTAAMLLVRIFHLHRKEERRRKDSPIDLEGDKEFGLFGKYTQLPHLFLFVLRRLENTADRLPVSESVTSSALLSVQSALRYLSSCGKVIVG